MSDKQNRTWPARESATHVTVTNARGDAVFHDAIAKATGEAT